MDLLLLPSLSSLPFFLLDFLLPEVRKTGCRSAHPLHLGLSPHHGAQMHKDGHGQDVLRDGRGHAMMQAGNAAGRGFFTHCFHSMA